MRRGPLVLGPAVSIAHFCFTVGVPFDTHTRHTARAADGRSSVFGPATRQRTDIQWTKVGEEASHPPQHCSSLHHTRPRGLAHRATPSSESIARARPEGHGVAALSYQSGGKCGLVTEPTGMAFRPGSPVPRVRFPLLSALLPARAARSRSRPHTWLLLSAACEPMWPAPAVHFCWRHSDVKQ